MKTIFKSMLIWAGLMLAVLSVSYPQPSVIHNGNGSSVGASATSQGGGGPVNGTPLDDGFIPLLILASVYGTLQFYVRRKSKKNLPSCQ